MFFTSMINIDIDKTALGHTHLEVLLQ